jgi:hypothetical protein
MSLRVQRSDWFIGDIEHYAAWYDREAGWDLAERYLRAVASTLLNGEHSHARPYHFFRSARTTWPSLHAGR